MGLPFTDDRRTVVIVAGGPSTGLVDLELTRGWPRIAVNDAWRLIPDADILYACDRDWWNHHFKEVAFHFKGRCWTQDGYAAKAYGLQRIEGEYRNGLCKKPGLIHFGRNSGHQAINLAWHFGARRFVLVGFDCTDGPQGSHWFGEHPGVLNKKSPYKHFAEAFAEIGADLKREGCQVINCSPLTALTCFPKGDLADVLQRSRAA